MEPTQEVFDKEILHQFRLIGIQWLKEVMITDDDSVMTEIRETHQVFRLIYQQYFMRPGARHYDLYNGTSQIKFALELKGSLHHYRSKLHNNFQAAADEMRTQLINGIKASQIHIEDGEFIFVFAFQMDLELAFGYSNNYVKSYTNNLVITHNTLKNCIYTCVQNYLIIRKLKHLDEYSTKNLVKKAGDFKRRITKSGFTLNHHLENDLKAISIYLNSEKCRDKIELEFEIYNAHFQPIKTIGNAKEKCKLRKIGTHVELLYEPGDLKEKIFEGLKKKHSLLMEYDSVAGEKIYKDEFQHFIYKNVSYKSYQELLDHLLNQGLIPDHYHQNYVKIETLEHKDKKILNSEEFCSVDIETLKDTEEGQEVPFMIGLGYYEKDNQIYRQWDGEETCVESFFTFLHKNLEKFNGKIFYSHNGGRFDHFILIRSYLAKEKSLFKLQYNNFIVASGSIITFAAVSKENSKMKIIFKDSIKMMPMGLGKLTDSFKVQHKKIGDFDIRGKGESWKDHKKEIGKYLKHDVLGLLECVESFRNEVYNISAIDILQCLTAPSLAISVFLKDFYKDNLYPIYENPVLVDKILRNYYYGGRNEIFYMGELRAETREESIAFLDINSLYPHSMTKKLPYGIPDILDREAMMDRKYILEGEILSDQAFGFVIVNVETLTNDYEGLPRLHAIHNGERLYFPDFDRKETIVVFSEEIKLSQFKKLPYRYEFLGMFAYHAHDYLSDFVNHFYSNKQKASKNDDEVRALIFKLFLNSSYGTFGMKKQRKCLGIFSENDLHELQNMWDKGKIVNLDELDSYCIAEYEDYIPTRCCSVAVASAITAYSRMLQWEFQYEFVMLGGDVLMGDTDSSVIKFNQDFTIEKFEETELYKEFVIGGEEQILGKLKCELKKYSKKMPPQDFEDYCLKYGIKNEDRFMLANRIFIAGCKMYFLFLEQNGKIYSKHALKGYKSKKGMNLDNFKELFSEQGLENEQTQFSVKKKDFSIHIHEIKKKFHNIYLKGLLITNEELEEFEKNKKIENEEEIFERLKKKRKIDFEKNSLVKIFPMKTSDVKISENRKFPLAEWNFILKNKNKF